MQLINHGLHVRDLKRARVRKLRIGATLGKLKNVHIFLHPIRCRGLTPYSENYILETEVEKSTTFSCKICCECSQITKIVDESISPLKRHYLAPYVLEETMPETEAGQNNRIFSESAYVHPWLMFNVRQTQKTMELRSLRFRLMIGSNSFRAL